MVSSRAHCDTLYVGQKQEKVYLKSLSLCNDFGQIK